jgi:hypothetical protein
MTASTAPVMSTHSGGIGVSANWVLQVDGAWSRAFNATWRDRLGDPPVYRMVGVGVRRRLGS